MTQEASTPTPVQEPLPQTHVLSYVSAINSPTRVRKIASIAVGLLGVVLTVAGVAGTINLANELWHYYDDWIAPGAWGPLGGPGRPGIRYVVGELLYAAYRRNSLLLALCLPWLFGPVLLFTARGVHRGRAFASQLAAMFMVVPFLQVTTLAAIFNGYALVMSYPINGRSEPEYLVRLLSLPAFLLPALLLIDLRTFLKWIVRNPSMEKPPASFLPGVKHG